MGKKRANQPGYKQAKGKDGRTIWVPDDSQIAQQQLSQDFNDFDSMDRDEIVENSIVLMNELDDSFVREGRSERNFNPFDAESRQLQKWSANAWDDDDIHNLNTIERMNELRNNDDLSREEKLLAYKDLRISMKLRGSSPRNEIFWSVAKYIQADIDTPVRSEQELQQFKHQEIPTSDRLTGLRDDHFISDNYTLNDIGGITPSVYTSAAINDIVQNGTMEMDYLDAKHYFYDDYDAVKYSFTQDPQLYLATVFPRKELKEKLDQYDINDVFVSSFHNGREEGNVYTVLQPDGGTMSFSVYEHRNTDSIIINGIENWDGEELPYCADSKDIYFAEFSPDDKDQVADTLAMYLKDAQRGELSSIRHLVHNAPRRDWKTILSDRVPGFESWYNKNNPDDKVQRNKSPEDVLKDLDFDPET